jgi:hypothetical protein
LMKAGSVNISGSSAPSSLARICYKILIVFFSSVNYSLA